MSVTLYDMSETGSLQISAMLSVLQDILGGWEKQVSDR